MIGPATDGRRAVAMAAATMGYEVLPFKGIRENVLRHVPRTVPLTVTGIAAKGTAGHCAARRRAGRGRLPRHTFRPGSPATSRN
jgi:hypothetical protein